MFIDHAVIHCIAGSGGNGCNSYERSTHLRHKRPTGGDGGRGGAIVLVGNPQVHTLLDVHMRRTFEAGPGDHGGSSHMKGAEGENRRVDIPLGTEIYDDSTGHRLTDVVHPNQEIVVCRGGEGGKGSTRNSEATRGFLGEDKQIRLELKLIADAGLIGCPNAGKSTLISHLSKARPRIAAFPFTTKEPVLGIVKGPYGDAFTMADIPGLIEGASRGRGLGHEFLRHVERTRMFVHIIDMASVDGRDPLSDYHTINQELESYSNAFKNRIQIVVANKMDLPEAQANLLKFKASVNVAIIEVSAATGLGLDTLSKEIFKRLDEKREVQS